MTDAAVVHSMIVRLAESTPAAIELCSTAADFATALSGDNPAIHALIAEHDNASLGVVIFYLTYSTWYGAPGVYVQDIFVAEESRGAGVGRKLLAGAVKWAAARGATHMKLSVDRDNTTAQSFYERCGMFHRDDEMMYMIVGEAFSNLVADV